MPSQAALFQKYFFDNKAKFQSEKYRKLIQKYGGREHLEVPEEIKISLPDQLTIEETIPHRKDLVKGDKKMKSSSYKEDCFIKGHKSVWGSFWNSFFGWGYACCLGFEKKAFCKGIEGKKEALRKIVC